MYEISLILFDICLILLFLNKKKQYDVVLILLEK